MLVFSPTRRAICVTPSEDGPLLKQQDVERSLGRLRTRPANDHRPILGARRLTGGEVGTTGLEPGTSTVSW